MFASLDAVASTIRNTLSARLKFGEKNCAPYEPENEQRTWVCRSETRSERECKTYQTLWLSTITYSFTMYSHDYINDSLENHVQ